jgi:glycosyltransferase involved in cell wall biosynthesis
LAGSNVSGLAREILRIHDRLKEDKRTYIQHKCLKLKVDKLKLIHIITDLNTGGAENMLFKLVSNMNKTEFSNKVISLTDVGSIGEKIQSIGVPVYALGMKAGVPDPRFLFKLLAVIRKEKPDIVQTWMYHADLMGGIATKVVGKTRIIWGIRQSNLDPMVNKPMTFWTVKACARLSNIVPEKIICCSEASRNVHISYGYNDEKMQVIPNGFNTNAFKPDCNANISVREELGLGMGDIIIGHVARFNPMKDHANLITAASIVRKKYSNVHFVLCGDGISWDNKELRDSILNTGLEKAFHLLGRRSDIPRLTAAFDIACLTSFCGEGFPNVIGEAMACEVPCVVTDVGDSASIVGDIGFVVPPSDSEKLAEALINMISIDGAQRKQLGIEARQRILDHFQINSIVNQYQDLYINVSNKLNYRKTK